MRFCGNSKPLLVMAARTRSRASRTALSARPTTVNEGRPRRMSHSTATRRVSTPSMAKLVTAESTSERPLEVLQRDERARGVDRHPDRVEAQLARERPVLNLGQVGGRHAPHLRLLGLVQRRPRARRAGAPRLDLDEDEGVAVQRDEVELAEPGPVAAGDELVAEPPQMGRGELLALQPQCVSQIRSHAREAPGDGVTPLRPAAPMDARMCAGSPRTGTASPAQGGAGERRQSASCEYATDW